MILQLTRCVHMLSQVGLEQAVLSCTAWTAQREEAERHVAAAAAAVEGAHMEAEELRGQLGEEQAARETAVAAAAAAVAAAEEAAFKLHAAQAELTRVRGTLAEANAKAAEAAAELRQARASQQAAKTAAMAAHSSVAAADTCSSVAERVAAEAALGCQGMPPGGQPHPVQAVDATGSASLRTAPPGNGSNAPTPTTAAGVQAEQMEGAAVVKASGNAGPLGGAGGVLAGLSAVSASEQAEHASLQARVLLLERHLRQLRAEQEGQPGSGQGVEQGTVQGVTQGKERGSRAGGWGGQEQEQQGQQQGKEQWGVSGQKERGVLGDLTNLRQIDSQDKQKQKQEQQQPSAEVHAAAVQVHHSVLDQLQKQQDIQPCGGKREVQSVTLAPEPQQQARSVGGESEAQAPVLLVLTSAEQGGMGTGLGRRRATDMAAAFMPEVLHGLSLSRVHVERSRMQEWSAAQAVAAAAADAVDAAAATAPPANLRWSSDAPSDEPAAAQFGIAAEAGYMVAATAVSRRALQVDSRYLPGQASLLTAGGYQDPGSSRMLLHQRGPGSEGEVVGASTWRGAEAQGDGTWPLSRSADLARLQHRSSGHPPMAGVGLRAQLPPHPYHGSGPHGQYQQQYTQQPTGQRQYRSGVPIDRLAAAAAPQVDEDLRGRRVTEGEQYQQQYRHHQPAGRPQRPGAARRATADISLADLALLHRGGGDHGDSSSHAPSHVEPRQRNGSVLHPPNPLPHPLLGGAAAAGRESQDRSSSSCGSCSSAAPALATACSRAADWDRTPSAADVPPPPRARVANQRYVPN